MKKIYFLTVLLFAAMLSHSQEKFKPKELFGIEANTLWQGAEHIWLKQENTVPAFIQFRAGREPDEATFFLVLKKTYVLPSSYDFKLKGTETDQLGWEHKRFQLTVNNIPVTNGIFLLHLQTGKVKKFNGYLFKNISVAASASLTESSALEFALKEIHAEVYKWQLPSEEEFLKRESADAGATFYPKGELEILQTGNNTSGVFKLVWKFDIYAHQPMSRNYVYVDAQTGEVLKTTTRIHDANTNGTAVTAYRGSRAIVSDSYNGSYRLRETTRGLGIRTFNMLTGTTYGNAVDFTDADNFWNNANANLDQYAGDGHWGAEMTYDFYQTMGRNSINGNGLQLNLYVHYDDGYVNAFWDGTRMTFGDGNGTYDPLTPLDITGHEISHGLDEYTANLDYSYESGALNESFSDIFGAAVEWFADSTQADWTMAEDIGPAFRSMSTPNAYGDPDTYQGTNWYTGTGDYGGVHTNSGVQNHWYYRLVQGGSGTNDIGNVFSVTSIGRTKATQIAWRNMVNYLSSSSDYADARFYAIQSANDLFGACSQEVVSTTKAWYAVGVGGDYVAGADAQFSASPLIGCTLPFTVNFTNASTNASSYTWYFGDGATSTATNPSHIYTLAGIYTVKLVANGGGTCGSDSVIYTNLINVSTSNPCTIVLPTTGTYQTQTSCAGIIYDSGGPTGDYTGNTSSTVTIAPTGASQVTLHFTQFDMEDTYDFLYVYDGPTTASPVIGSFTGTTIPADITSTGSSITVRQFSDPYVEGAGFTIQWSCIIPVVTPVANFIADVTQSCTGAIKFTDLTSGGVIAWLWNFGDGNTSTVQHPTHVYPTNGVFTVSLTATNTFGSNTATKNNYITVAKPAGPNVSNSSSCGPLSYTLSTGDANPATWFDDAGNVVSNANPFITPVLNTTTTYYVQDTVPQPVYRAGPATNTAVGATGSNFNNNATLGLKFNVFKKSVLQSVLVYATGDGYRTIQYRDSIGGIISQKSVFIPNGTSRVTLNIDLVPGSSYLLRMKDTTNLYRNQGGAVFPYNDAGGIVSITGNNAGTAPTNYYYFYDWEVKEQDCISLQTPVTLTIKPAVTATSAFTNISCFGGSNGSVSVAPVGGTPGFTYQWSNSATTSSISNIAAGLYLVTVTDTLGCTTLSGQMVSQPTAIVPSSSATNVSCNGGNNGTISLSVNGGTPGYSFNWSGGVTSQNRTSLIAGTYPVTVTDANLCSATSSATVNQPAVLVPLATAVDVSCNGGNNGAINLNVTGGTTSYSYDWGSGITSQNRTSLIAGTYSVTVTDANLCTAYSSAIVNQPTAITPSTAITDVTCNGQNTGAISLTVTGGVTSYTFNWGGGIVSQNRTALVAGTYFVTITDANLCTVVSSATINEPTAINIPIAVSNTSCGLANGNASVNASGGTPGYAYLWNTGLTSPSINNLSAGSYFVTVTDNNNCTVSISTTINSSSSLSATGSPVDVNCFGNSDGSVTVSLNNGAQPFTYLWSGGETTQSVTNIQAGSYSVTITDGDGCTATLSQTVSEPAALNISVTPTNAECNLNNGSAIAVASGGTAGYDYEWSTGETTTTIGNLTAGNYSVTITDSHSCTATTSITIVNASSLVADAASTNVLCYGFANGSADINVTSGTQPFTYLWSNGETTSSIGNLTVGNYFVTITDGSNCESVDTVVVTQPSPISLFLNIVYVSCNGGNDGSADISATGGNPNYIFNWSNSQSGNSITNLTAGNYSVTVNDANNCSSVSNFTVPEPDAVVVTNTVIDVSCFGGTDGSASITVTGGTPSYSYQWCNGSNSTGTTNLISGTCTVTVTDQNGCVTTASAIINEPAEIQFTVSSTVATVGMNNGAATVTSSGGIGPYNVQWSNGGDGTNLAAGNYSFTISDANGCIKTGSVVVDEVTGLSQIAGEFALSIYPNPAADEILVVLNEWKAQTTFSLKNVLGQTLLNSTISTSTTRIELSAFATGIYMFEITQGDMKRVKEFVIAR